MNIFFTSDLHFYHKNVIGYCNRPFKDVHHMNEVLINNWNSVVTNNDWVYVLGDFGFKGITHLEKIIQRLNGGKVLIMGNHDWHRKPARWVKAGFTEVFHTESIVSYPFPKALYGDQAPGILLNHFPYEGDHSEDDRFQKLRPHDDGKTWLLHGHVHNEWQVKGRQINVGVDVWNYFPVRLEIILRIIDEKSVS